MERCSFFIDPLSRPGLDLPFFFFFTFFFFLLPVASILDSTFYFLFFYISPFKLFWKENQQGFFGLKKQKQTPVWNWKPLVTCPHHQTPAAAAWRCGWGGPFFFFSFFCILSLLLQSGFTIQLNVALLPSNVHPFEIRSWMPSAKVKWGFQREAGGLSFSRQRTNVKGEVAEWTEDGLWGQMSEPKPRAEASLPACMHFPSGCMHLLLYSTGVQYRNTWSSCLA